jgi:hypothetical protein
MLSAVSYFNLWVDKGTLQDLSRIGTWQKVAIVALTALESFVIGYAASRAGFALICTSLPLTGLCVIATFRVLVTLAASYIPPTNSNNSSPIKKEKTGTEIRKEQCEMLIRELLTPHQELGAAINNGDCFYDAIAQLLQIIGINATVESLRKDISAALTDPRWVEHLRKKVEQDPRGIGSFEEYSKQVVYTPTKQGETEHKDPIWGDPSREGVILCEKYKFNLRILKAGVMEGNIEGDIDLQIYKNLRDQTADQKLLQTYENDVQARYRQLYADLKNYYSDEENIPLGKPYPLTLTIVLFGEHFLPVITR